jgi:drug/metabolite transporter superfamily protein YnfA
MNKLCRHNTGRLIVVGGLVALPIYVLCFSVLFPERFSKDFISTGYLFIFFFIAVGSVLQKKPQSTTLEPEKNVEIIRKPFRILSGMIAVLGLIGTSGAIWAYIKEGSQEILPIILLVSIAVFLSGFLAYTGRVPFTKK